MKQEIIDLFTKRMIDYSLINWIEFILLFTIVCFVFAVIKYIIEGKE